MIRVTYNEEPFGDITSESVCFFEKEDKIVFEFLGGDEWVDTFLPLDRKDIIKIKKQVKDLTLEECEKLFDGNVQITLATDGIPNFMYYEGIVMKGLNTKMNDYVDVTALYKDVE